VFITAASGATLAGFLLAENALRAQGLPPIRLIGVRVHQGPIRAWIRSLIRWSEWKLGLSTRLPASRIELLDSELNGGFGRYSPALVELCRRVQALHGLKIDPIFGGKTWSAMEAWLARNRPRGPVVYWHCGYTPDWESLGVVWQP
jgi:1-aminocyclopropane-1-carboxylate deaminase/D-cysteine desulfhydrase-like pyridoxal-dependent ACC family enzyme